jgi:RimJ/RimL family protein N-acetyltransferase
MTEHLVLKPFSPIQVRGTHHEWLNDPDVVRYSEQRHRTHTVLSARRYLATVSGHIWGIYPVDTSRLIGTIVAHVDPYNRIAQVGIMIGNKKVWGRGYGRQAWRAVCDWLLEPDGGGLRKVESGCMAANQAMRHVFEATGMQYESEQKNHFLLDGTPVGLVHYARFK